MPQLSTASINVEFVEDPSWTGFEFITKKKGPEGPTKEECEKYYADWYVSDSLGLLGVKRLFCYSGMKLFVTEILNNTF